MSSYTESMQEFVESLSDSQKLLLSSLLVDIVGDTDEPEPEAYSALIELSGML